MPSYLGHVNGYYNNPFITGSAQNAAKTLTDHVNGYATKPPTYPATSFAGYPQTAYSVVARPCNGAEYGQPDSKSQTSKADLNDYTKFYYLFEQHSQNLPKPAKDGHLSNICKSGTDKIDDDVYGQECPDSLGLTSAGRAFLEKVRLERTNASNYSGQQGSNMGNAHLDALSNFNNLFKLSQNLPKPPGVEMFDHFSKPAPEWIDRWAYAMADPASSFAAKSQNVPQATASADQMAAQPGSAAFFSGHKLGQMSSATGVQAADHPAVASFTSKASVSIIGVNDFESEGSDSAKRPNNSSSQPSVTANDIQNTSSSSTQGDGDFSKLLDALINNPDMLDYVCFKLQAKDYESMLKKWKQNPNRCEMNEDDMCLDLKKLVKCQQLIARNRTPMAAKMLNKDLTRDQLSKLYDRLIKEDHNRYSFVDVSHADRLLKIGQILEAFPSKQAVQKLTSDQMKAEVEKLKKNIEMINKMAQKRTDDIWMKKQLMKFAFLMKDLSVNELFGKDCSAHKAKYDFFKEFLVDGLVALAKQSDPPAVANVRN